MGLQEKFQTALRESKTREDAIRANPEIANTPAMKKMYRQHGVVMVVLGLAVAIGDVIGWEVIGGALVYMIAIPLVLIPAGMYMIVTGKNPFRKKSR